jgi:dTDP-4-amino-4,6-dideoxygalactose transaminase
MPSAISVLPVLTGRALLGGPPCLLPSVAALGVPSWVASGEVAIRGALLLAGIGAGDEVLVPAFNCPSMVAPIRALGATPVFYGIHEDLSLNRADLDARLTRSTRAIIAPHLFGRIQRLAELRALCDSARITLIEDCAHAFFGTIGGVAIGSQGHFAIASPRKFFPLAEGGLLIGTSPADLGARLRDAPLTRSVRVMFDAVDLAVRSARLPALRPLVACVKALRSRSRRVEPSAAELDASRAAPADSAGASRIAAAAAVTRWMIRRTATAAEMQLRERNFRQLREALAPVRGVRVLDTAANDVAGTVPYMLPVVLSAPAAQFAQLKAMGTPMWRWEYSQTGICKTTDWLAQAMIQLPCHQAMGDADLALLVRNIEAASARL